MNNNLHIALATQLDDVQETIFFYNGFVCFIQDHSTETWEFDIGRREDNEETTHIDGGFFDGTASDAIAFVVDMANDIANRG